MEKGWIEVYLTAHEYRATMAIDLLESAGIKAVLMNQHDTAYKSFGDFVVYVEQSDEQPARELLKDLKH
jgi:hypothetical protein